MIGGSGNRLAKIARTKSSPDIDAITSMGTMPYSIACLPHLSSMIPTHHVVMPDLIRAFMIVQRGLPGQAARPYGKYSMVDIDQVGGVQVIIRELLEAGLLNGDVMTCTGETLAHQVKCLGTKAVDGKVIYSVAKPYKPTGGLRVLGGNLSPEFSAIL